LIKHKKVQHATKQQEWKPDISKEMREEAEIIKVHRDRCKAELAAAKANLKAAQARGDSSVEEYKKLVDIKQRKWDEFRAKEVKA